MEIRFVASIFLFFLTAILAIITSTNINGIINGHDIEADDEKFRGAFDHNTFIRAVYQMCPDENNDFEAIDFLTGSKKNLVSYFTDNDTLKYIIYIVLYYIL